MPRSPVGGLNTRVTERLFCNNAMDDNANIRIFRLPGGADNVNTYLVACRNSGKVVIIDPAGDPRFVLQTIEANELKPVMILNTHGHGDHVEGNRELKKSLSVPTAMHRADDDFFKEPDLRREFEKILGHPCPDPVDRRLEDGDKVRFGDLALKVLHTPGHTPGSACFLCEGHLFTGDTLFVGAVGRTDLPGGSLEQLLASLEHKLITLPPETIVWPGHDYGETPTSTIGREMQENPYITDFLLDD